MPRRNEQLTGQQVEAALKSMYEEQGNLVRKFPGITSCDRYERGNRYDVSCSCPSEKQQKACGRYHVLNNDIVRLEGLSAYQ